MYHGLQNAVRPFNTCTCSLLFLLVSYSADPSSGFVKGLGFSENSDSQVELITTMSHIHMYNIVCGWIYRFSVANGLWELSTCSGAGPRYLGAYDTVKNLTTCTMYSKTTSETWQSTILKWQANWKRRLSFQNVLELCCYGRSVLSRPGTWKNQLKKSSSIRLVLPGLHSNMQTSVTSFHSGGGRTPFHLWHLLLGICVSSTPSIRYRGSHYHAPTRHVMLHVRTLYM